MQKQRVPCTKIIKEQEMLRRLDQPIWQQADTTCRSLWSTLPLLAVKDGSLKDAAPELRHSLSHTDHWRFNMAPHCKELSEDLKKRTVAPHKDCLDYKKIANTLKMSCSIVVKTIQQFKGTGSTQNRPHHGRPKMLSAHAQHHIQR